MVVIMNWIDGITKNTIKRGKSTPFRMPSLKPFNPIKMDMRSKNKTSSASEIITKVKSFLTKLNKGYSSKFIYRIDKDSDRMVHLSTDGVLYDLIYDPSSSEENYLRRDAAKEFGWDFKPVDTYRHQTAFSEMLGENGWGYELYGGGVIHIYKE